MAYGAASPPARLEQFTPATITDPGLLAEELRNVRARGYATTVGELEPGLVAVAAPVLGAGANRSPPSASPGRSCGSTATGWSSWATCWSPRSPHSPSDLATIP